MWWEEGWEVAPLDSTITPWPNGMSMGRSIFFEDIFTAIKNYLRFLPVTMWSGYGTAECGSRLISSDYFLSLNKKYKHGHYGWKANTI